MFGVGVLLFGTPALLILGHPFATVLGILLPVSLTINILQVVPNRTHIEVPVVKGLTLFAIPTLAVTLWLALEVALPIEPVVGVFLIFVASGEIWSWTERLFAAGVRRKRTFMVAIGAVHGLTNLGGALLTALVYGEDLDKLATRTTTAAAYAVFAFIQLATLAASGVEGFSSATAVAWNVGVGAGVFALVEYGVYRRTTASAYRGLFSGLLLVAGVVILTRFFLSP